MKKLSIILAAVFSGALAFAQMCPPVPPGSVCLVPPSNMQTTATTAYTPTAVAGVAMMPMTCPTGNMGMTCPTGMYTTQFPAGNTYMIFPAGATGTTTGAVVYPYGGTTAATMPYCPSTSMGAMVCPSSGVAATTLPACPSTGAIVYPYGGSTTATLPACPSTGAIVYPYSGATASTLPACPSTGAIVYPYGGTTSASISGISATNIPSAGAMICQPAGGIAQQACPSATSPDTNCIISAINGLRMDLQNTRSTVRAVALQQQGHQLIDRMRQLAQREVLFRQAIAANPNLPGAQLTAVALQNEATALSSDIAAFSRELALISPDQRQFIAADLANFDVVYWTPALQSFNAYAVQFPSGITAYQVAFTPNPWLQGWTASFQNTLNTITTIPQTYASARWWTTTNNQIQVLGSMESYPCIMMQPQATTLPAPVIIPMATTITITPAAPAATTPPPATTPEVLGTEETTPMPMPAPEPTPMPAPQPMPPTTPEMW